MAKLKVIQVPRIQVNGNVTLSEAEEAIRDFLVTVRNIALPGYIHLAFEAKDGEGK